MTCHFACALKVKNPKELKIDNNGAVDIASD